MINDNPNFKPAIAAAIAAGLLMAFFGLTHRILAARMPTPTNNAPLAPGALGGFPMQIRDWKGQDVPFDRAVLGEIGADASINRLYSRGSGSQSVSLFIAASAVTAGTLVGHPPEICNVQSGYALTYDRSAELLLDDGTKLPCGILRFSYGGSLGMETRTVLCYYTADGQFYGGRSLLRSRMRRDSGVTCVAQIQIVASAGIATADSATELATAFAIDSASSMARLFADISETQKAGEANKPLKEE